MRHADITYHLLYPALALLLAASTLTAWVEARTVALPAHAAAHAIGSASPGRGFTGAFGSGQALRNLLYID